MTKHVVYTVCVLRGVTLFLSGVCNDSQLLEMGKPPLIHSFIQSHRLTQCVFFHV